MIDLVLAGDNAVAVGMAASGLPLSDRRKVILAGLGAAVVLRIGLALLATRLLSLIGLMFAGGLLLLWVCWKMWRDLRAQAAARRAQVAPPAKSFAQAFLQIFIADLSMSLDNVLAVAGAALNHPFVLVFGLLLSIVLMGVAANAIARVLHRMHWIAYVGVAIVFYVAVHMMWDGYRDTVIDMHKTGAYNAAMPAWLDIQPAEIAKHSKK